MKRNLTNTEGCYPADIPPWWGGPDDFQHRPVREPSPAAKAICDAIRAEFANVKQEVAATVKRSLGQKQSRQQLEQHALRGVHFEEKIVIEDHGYGATKFFCGPSTCRATLRAHRPNRKELAGGIFVNDVADAVIHASPRPGSGHKATLTRQQYLAMTPEERQAFRQS